MNTTRLATVLAAMAAMCLLNGMVYAAPSQSADSKGKAYEWDFTKGIPSGGKPRKRFCDCAGYACAVDGVCTLKVRTNLNDPEGSYRVVCRDRASGLTCEQPVMQK